MVTERREAGKPGRRGALAALFVLIIGLMAIGPAGAVAASRFSGGGRQGWEASGASHGFQTEAVTPRAEGRRARFRSAGGRFGPFPDGTMITGPFPNGTMITGPFPFAGSPLTHGLGASPPAYRPLFDSTRVEGMGERTRGFVRLLPGPVGAGPGLDGAVRLHVGRTRFMGEFDHHRYLDLGAYDRFRREHRFDQRGFGRFRRFGFYNYCPAFVPYATFVFPDEFLFGNWLGADTSWWYGVSAPSAGVSVPLIYGEPVTLVIPPAVPEGLPEQFEAPAAPQAEGFLSVLSPMLGGGPRVSADFAVGELKLHQGDYAAAEDALRDAVSESPDQAAPKLALGLAMAGASDYEGAAQLVERGLRAMPDWRDLHLAPARAFGSDDAYRRVVNGLQNAGADHDARFVLGFLYFASGRYAEAAGQLKSANQSDPLVAGLLQEAQRRAGPRPAPDETNPAPAKVPAVPLAQ